MESDDFAWKGIGIGTVLRRTAAAGWLLGNGMILARRGSENGNGMTVAADDSTGLIGIGW